jgi:hypothetical protein
MSKIEHRQTLYSNIAVKILFVAIAMQIFFQQSKCSARNFGKCAKKNFKNYPVKSFKIFKTYFSEPSKFWITFT